MNAMNPLVSVVIPSFNRRELLLLTLENVFEQSYWPMEVIVVDDASTDGTREALMASRFWQDIVYEKLAANGGPAVARNAGIARASGRYIAFMESDDLWVRTKLARQVAAMEARPDRDSLVLYSRLWIQRPQEVQLRPLRGIRPREPLADYLFVNGGFIAQHTVLMPAGLARKVLYDGTLRLHEDWDFYLRLQAQGASFAMLDEPLAIYFYDGDGADRASTARPQQSLTLLERWKPGISHTAYLALRAKVAPQLRTQAPLLALRCIGQAWAGGAVGTLYALSLVGTLVHPGLRRLAYIARGFAQREARRQLPPELRRAHPTRS